MNDERTKNYLIGKINELARLSTVAKQVVEQLNLVLTHCTCDDEKNAITKAILIVQDIEQNAYVEMDRMRKSIVETMNDETQTQGQKVSYRIKVHTKSKWVTFATTDTMLSAQFIMASLLDERCSDRLKPDDVVIEEVKQ